MPSSVVRLAIVCPNDEAIQVEIQNYLSDFVEKHELFSELKIYGAHVEDSKTNMILYCSVKVTRTWDVLLLQKDFDDRYPDYIMFTRDFLEGRSLMDKILMIISLCGSVGSIISLIVFVLTSK
jgi:hypothetical protein